MRESPERLENCARGPDQRIGPRSGLHAPRGPDEQRIAELAPQFAERNTNCRLTLLEQLGRPSDASSTVENVEKAQLPNVQLVGGTAGIEVGHCVRQYTYYAHCMYSMGEAS